MFSMKSLFQQLGDHTAYLVLIVYCVKDFRGIWEYRGVKGELVGYDFYIQKILIIV